MGRPGTHPADARGDPPLVEVGALSFWLLTAGGTCAFASQMLGSDAAVQSVFDERASSWLWCVVGPPGLAIVLLLVVGFLGSHAKERRLTALPADGHASVGRADEVITHPGIGEEQATYEFQISPGLLPGPALPRRRLSWGEEDGWISPERRVGRAARFRRNTLDPDDRHDVLFDGWPDQAKRDGTTGDER